MRKTDKKQTFEQGALILLLSAILSKLIGALFKIPLSSDFCLGDLGFGYFSSAYDLISPILLLSVSGLPVAVSKLVSECISSDKKDEAEKTFRISRILFLITGMIASLIALILVFPLSYAADNTGKSLYCYLAIIPSFLFCCLASAYKGYFEGLINMVPPAVSALIEALSKLCLGFSFAIITIKSTNNASLAAAMALLGITSGTLFSCGYLHICYKRNSQISLKSRYNISDDKFLVKRIIAIALPIALYSFSGSVVGLIDSITVRWQLSGMFESDFTFFENMFSSVIDEANVSNQAVNQATLPTFLYGIRSKAFTLYNIVPTLTAYLGVSAVPHISSAFKKGDRQSLTSSCSRVLKLAAIISFPAGIGFIALNERIMFLLYGESNSSVMGGKMLIALGIATALSGISVVMGNVLQALGKQNVALFNVAVGIFAKIIFNLLLCGIPQINIYGSVFSTGLCFAIIFILNTITLIKLLGSMFEIKSIFIKPFISALICGVSAFTVSLIQKNSVVTVLSIAVAIAVFVISLALLKVFSDAEIADFPLVSKLLKSKNAVDSGKNAQK